MRRISGLLAALALLGPAGGCRKKAANEEEITVKPAADPLAPARTMLERYAGGSRSAAKPRPSRTSSSRSARPTRPRPTPSRRLWPTSRRTRPAGPRSPRKCSTGFDGSPRAGLVCRMWPSGSKPALSVPNCEWADATHD